LHDEIEWLYQFLGDTKQVVIQSDVIFHASLVFILCHGYQYSSIEKSGELPIYLFNSFRSLQQQSWLTYLSICSIFRALQGAVIEIFVYDIFKNSFDIPDIISAASYVLGLLHQASTVYRA